MPSKPQYLSSMEASEDVAAAAAAASAAGESHTSTLGSGGSSSSHAYGSMMMSSAGSVPVQMPGRSYYKYRSASAAGGAHHQGPGGHQPMSLTQSHIDIREGSARLASLGLAEDLEALTDDEGMDESVFAPSSAASSSSSAVRDGAPKLARTSGAEPSSRGASAASAASDALLLDPSPSSYRATSGSPAPHTPSGLSMLREKHERKSSASAASSLGSTPRARDNAGLPLAETAGEASSSGSDTVGQPTPTSSSPKAQLGKSTAVASTPSTSAISERHESPNASAISDRRRSITILRGKQGLEPPSDAYSERSPLLRRSRAASRSSTGAGRRASESRSPSVDRRYKPFQTWQNYFDKTKERFLHHAHASYAVARKQSAKEIAINCILEPIKTFPAVILGLMMNLLDGVSYGMIMFPVSSPVFASFGGIGVSMFFASCFVSQIVYSSRSIFKGGNGSMMIEVVPFLHVIAFTISDRLGGAENAHAVISTTMVAYALTGILTGLTFFLMGFLKLGTYIEFFPRVVLVGCIGGVGAFLIITGVQVCAGLENETLTLSWEVISRFFEKDLFILWFLPLLLAALLRIVTYSRFDHPLVFPLFFLFVPIIFYIVVLSAHIPLSTLREKGWIFDMAGVNTPWYEYFTLYDFKAVDVRAVLETMPTQAALVFFALLHVPINVPALALSVGEDNVETDNELVNHGFSNFLSGCVGSIPNYLVYTNSVLFYRVGGTSRLSSFMLALATLIVFLIGPWIIGYLPVMIVGTLIYILGYDLVKEAVWDTWGRVSGFDYATILIIIFAMTYFDFVVGIGVGIVAACVSFVIVSSQRQPIRAIMSGTTASSTVRRHPRQSAFLRKIGTQTRVIKLQSFLFFGTVVKVEAKIRELLDDASWRHSPIRFLILDFTLASGLDFSAAEAFLRIQRLLQVKNVILVICGCDIETPVGKALHAVDLLNSNDDSLIRVFSTLNDALEHCENSQLRTLYSKTLDPHASIQQPEAINVGVDASYRLAAAENGSPNLSEFSPRRTHLLNAANETLVGRRVSMSEALRPANLTPSKTPSAATGQPKIQLAEPLRLLMQSLSPYSPELKEDFFYKLLPYFTKKHIDQGEVLWTTGEVATSMYLLESGILKAVYEFPDSQPPKVIYESMLPGTIAGEMTFLARSKRNATVVAERDATLWVMTLDSLAELEEKEGPQIARAFRQVLLRVSAESSDVLMGHLIAG